MTGVQKVKLICRSSVKMEKIQASVNDMSAAVSTCNELMRNKHNLLSDFKWWKRHL